MTNEIKYGKVCWFKKNLGYGFITSDDGQDVFVHYSDINMEGYKNLQKDQRVSFEIGLNNRNQPKAINVIALND